MLAATLVSIVILVIMFRKFRSCSEQQARNAIVQDMLTAAAAGLLFFLFKTSLFESFAIKSGIPYSVIVKWREGAIYVTEMFCFSAFGIWLALKKQKQK